MKTKKIISILTGFGLAVSFYACHEIMDVSLSQSDLSALNGIRESYDNAFNENESLKISIEQSDSSAINMHDSLFHHYEELFDEHHDNYSHENNHDDHHHGNQNMHMGDTSMHHGAEDGHHQEDHEQMDDLMADHESVLH